MHHSVVVPKINTAILGVSRKFRLERQLFQHSGTRKLFQAPYNSKFTVLQWSDYNC
ncbi:hypothetical protein MA16_Dca024197 [Dendrobium catenatum]|uniref:Uncharacterized protein n=1 Tax=Dendrobium catenatum TaxID=906689 RepID=A0A2I0VH29_9ASPA|nr:hypothetical protein MA16_Dca024197 [Dendrobium catenatum]